MAVMLSEFDDFPKEKALIGEMIMAYGEIEFVMTGMIGTVFKGHHDTGVRVMFRARGEGPRLGVADAILQRPLKEVGLDGLWSVAFGASKYCKGIRNQYAHCHWHNDERFPSAFMNLDRDVGTRGEEVQVTFEPVDLTLIEQQHAYFDYALHLLYFLEAEFRAKLRVGPPNHGIVAPKSIPQPPTSNFPKSPTLPSGADRT